MENPQAEPTPARSSRVLLIEDDDLDVLAFVRELGLRQLPVELQRARNAEEAFEMLRLQLEEQRRDGLLIVLDLNMPGMNGIEFLRDLRQDQALGNSLVIAYTTSAAEVDVAAAYRYHVAAYVTKDVIEDSTRRLFDLVEQFLRVVTLPPVRMPVGAAGA